MESGRMKTLALGLILVFTGCAVQKPLPLEEMAISREAEFTGGSKGDIFDKSRVWIERHLYSKRNIIDFADKEAGVIVANGYIDYPAVGKIEAIEKVQYTISFTMKEQISDSRVTITFSNLLVDVPPRYYRSSRFWPMEQSIPGYSVPITERTDFEAARRGLPPIADRLIEYLKQNRNE
jgi:hypothetical protein